MLLPYKLASRENHPDNTIIEVGDIRIGEEKTIIAGPCAVEDKRQLIDQARALKKMGANILRGGAYKPRTSPYSFHGLEQEGLTILSEAGNESGLPVITEITDIRNIELVCKHADILQIGSRNMQNFALLRELGKIDHPVMLKRGFSATIEEWLLAAEYILAEGNKKVILCERGIRSFDSYTRNTFDINAVPAVKNLSHLPLIADPSHGTGRRELVSPVARAALAAGADGIMIEAHPIPGKALSDGSQSLTMEETEKLIRELRTFYSQIAS